MAESKRKAKVSPTQPEVEITQAQEVMIAGDTALASLVNGPDTKEAQAQRLTAEAVDYNSYLKPGDIAESYALVLFKNAGVDSKEIAPEMFISPHPNRMGDYPYFNFEKPGIVMLAMPAWRYFEAEILPTLGRDPELNLLGCDQKFSSLPRQVMHLIIYNSWSTDFLNAIDQSESLGYLRGKVQERLKRIEGGEDVKVTLTPTDTFTGEETPKFTPSMLNA